MSVDTPKFVYSEQTDLRDLEGQIGRDLHEVSHLLGRYSAVFLDPASGKYYLHKSAFVEFLRSSFAQRFLQPKVNLNSFLSPRTFPAVHRGLIYFSIGDLVKAIILDKYRECLEEDNDSIIVIEHSLNSLFQAPHKLLSPDNKALALERIRLTMKRLQAEASQES